MLKTKRFLLISLISFIFSLTFLAKIYPYFYLDLMITNLIQQIDFVSFDELMVFLSFLGNPYPMLVTFSAVVLTLFVLNKKSEGLFVFISTVGAIIISESIKSYIARPRPDPNLILHALTYGKMDSFPSGHVLYFMGFYGSILYLAYTKTKSNTLRLLLLSLTSFLLSFIGLSRVYLGAHWFSDVLGSYLIGFVWLQIVIFIYGKHR